jgi:hypothetical protein
MRVGTHLRLRSGFLRGVRLLLLAAAAAALASAVPTDSLTLENRIGMAAATLLCLWLLARMAGVLLGIPKPRPRCPRCAHKVVLQRGVKSCPTCNVSFKEKVRRQWRNTAPVESPWITRPHTLRLGQFSRR